MPFWAGAILGGMEPDGSEHEERSLRKSLEAKEYALEEFAAALNQTQAAFDSTAGSLGG